MYNAITFSIHASSVYQKNKPAVLILVCLTCLYAFQAAPAPKSTVPTDLQAVLDRIRPNSLRGDLSFIASDLLEGSNTPSRGLDIAAEYIAAHLRPAVLDPTLHFAHFTPTH